MKKFLVTLFILAVLAGLAFFFGWAQLQVPPGAYGIVRSKTHGLDPRPVRSGEFRWIWYKLIPTNVEITVLRLEPVNHTVNAGNSLPSGGIYAAFAGIPGDFSWEIGASFSFSINPDALVSLAADTHIGSQEDLDRFEQSLAGQIEDFIVRRLNTGDARRTEELLTGGSSKEFEREVTGQFPAITNFSCVIKTAKFPDFVLYRQIQGLYEDFISRQRELATAGLGQKEKSLVDAQLHFGELEQYGALLTKYPILLEYLSIQNRTSK
jgi:hypothetical protein